MSSPLPDLSRSLPSPPQDLVVPIACEYVVIAGTAIGHIISTTSTDDVVSRASRHPVYPPCGPHMVVTRAGANSVIATQAEYDVPSPKAYYHVVAGSPKEDISPVTAHDGRKQTIALMHRNTLENDHRPC